MGRHCALVVGILAFVAAACGSAADAPAPPTTGTTIATPRVPGSPPIDPPEWFPRWDDPALVAAPPVGDGFAGIAVGPGGLVAYGLDTFGPIATRISFSVDGSTWEPATVFEGVQIVAIEGGGPGYVAVGGRHLATQSDGSLLEPAAWWSADGRSWQEAAVEVPADAGVPAVFRLADWEIRDGSWMEDVVYDGEVGLAVGRSAGGARNVVWTSRDGATWTEAPGTEPAGPAHVTDIVAGTAGYLALGAEDPRGHDPGPVALWHSRNGAAWDQVASFDPEQGPLPWAVARLGAGFVAIGGDGYRRPVAWVSADGVEWSPPRVLPTGESASVLAVAGSGDLIVAAGFEDRPDGRTAPVVWLSADGVNWAQQAPAGDGAESYVSAVAWLDDHWRALGRTWGLPDGEISGTVWRGR